MKNATFRRHIDTILAVVVPISIIFTFVFLPWWGWRYLDRRSLKGNSASGRRMAIEDVTNGWLVTRSDRRLLRAMAETDPESSVRVTAARALNDQDLLTRIALDPSAASVQGDAAEGITDKETLIRIAFVATEDANEVIKQKLPQDGVPLDVAAWVWPESTAKLDDEKTLVKIAVSSRVPEIRLAAVGKLTNAASLFTIFARAGALDARKAAYYALFSSNSLYMTERDQAVLDKVSEICAGDPSLRMAGSTLRTILTTPWYKDDMLEITHILMAEPYVKDLGYLEDMAVATGKDSTRVIGWRYTRSSNDKSAEPYVDNTRGGPRLVAGPGVRVVERITEGGRAPDLFSCKMSKLDGELKVLGRGFWALFLDAIPHLSQESLTRLATECPSREVCRAAIARISDQATLADLADKALEGRISKYDDVFYSAVQSITNKDVLLKLADKALRIDDYEKTNFVAKALQRVENLR